MIKGETNLLLAGLLIAIFAIGALFGISKISGTLSEHDLNLSTGNEGNNTTGPVGPNEYNTVPELRELAMLPDDDNIWATRGYLHYLYTIVGDTSPEGKCCVKGVIEGTVVGLRMEEKCGRWASSDQEECKFLYPYDTGIIKVEKIIELRSSPSQKGVETDATYEPPVEPVPTPSDDNNTLVTPPFMPNYEVPPAPQFQGCECRPLEEGEEVNALFVFTARPAKIIYVHIPQPATDNDFVWEHGEVSGPRASTQQIPLPVEGNTNEYNQTVGHAVNEVTAEHPLDTNYEVLFPWEVRMPLTVDKYGYIVFAFESDQNAQKTLPGLDVGYRIRANVYYDGRMLYIWEYEIIGIPPRPK